MPELTTLNPQQQQAVTHGEGPLLIIAGAGTGKTTVITERIKYLITQKHVLPSQILALTFTEKASAEMEERVDIALPYGVTGVWIETFHGFCDRVLRNDAFHIGLSSDYKLLTEAEAVLFLRKHLFALGLTYFKPLGNPNKFIQGLLQHFSRLKDEDVQPDQYLDWVKTKASQKQILSDEEKEEIEKYQELANAYKKFEELKIQEGVMDFSDLISNTLALFRKRKHILAQYQQQFSYLLVDEFQDTNYAQNQLAILLAGTKQNITVVGDDDQSIYRFRGSSISNIMQFKTHFPTTTIVTLTQNYRSTQSILDGAYQLIQQNNPDRLEIKEHIDKRLTSLQKTQGEPIELLLHDTGDNESDMVIKKIKLLMKKEKYTYKDFAILVRANDYAQPFVRALERNKIPYQFLGPGQLFHQEEIKDLIAYLKVLYNYEDSASMYRVLTMPIFGISAATIATLLNTAKRRNKTLFELCQDPELPLVQTEKEKVHTIITMLQKHLTLVPTEHPGFILYSFIQESGLLQTMLNPTTPHDETKAENIASFFDKLKIFETDHEDNSLFAAVDWIDLSMQMGESPLAANADWGELDAVNVLTIHASKGLEFPVVFIVNMVKDRFPSRQRREQIPLPQALIKEVLPEGDFHLEEERRLAYVGLTRAQKKLFLTAAKFYGEGKRERKLSPFISETVGKDTVDKIQLQQNKKSLQMSIFEMLPQDNPTIILPQTEKTIHTISYLSYSQLQTFDMCPLHYKLRYILKIPTPQTASQTFGTSVHAVLRDFYQQQLLGNILTLNDIDTLLKQNWISEGYTSKEHEKESYAKAKDVLTNFLSIDYKSNHLPLALELPFEFYVNNMKVGGRIDRIDDLGNGTIEIIDYKTGTNVPDEKSLTTNLQLTTYALAAKQLSKTFFKKDVNEILLSLYYLEENKKLTTTRTVEQLDEAKDTFIQKAEEIAQSDFLCNKSIFCQNCEYKMICNTHI